MSLKAHLQACGALSLPLLVQSIICSPAVLAYEPFSDANIQIDQEDVKRDQIINKQLDLEYRKAHKLCLDANKTIYLRNKKNLACVLLGKCEPTTPCVLRN
jgi:hypothetical protein